MRRSVERYEGLMQPSIGNAFLLKPNPLSNSVVAQIFK
jgi:hypothetical protein